MTPMILMIFEYQIFKQQMIEYNTLLFLYHSAFFPSSMANKE